MIPDAKLTTARLRTLRSTLDVNITTLTGLSPVDRLATAACQFLCMAIDVELEEREAKTAKDRK